MHRILKKSWFYILVLICISLASNFPVLQNDFLNWDDHKYIHENHIIKDFSAKGLTNIFLTRPYLGYIPITMLSYAIDYKISGLDPFTFHLTNLILHLLNSILVFLFIRLLLKLFNSKNNLLIAFIASLLFAIHPAHVESIAWISERKDLLYSLFLLCSLYLYLKFLEKDRKISFLIFSIIFFLLSLFSKGMGLFLPFILLAIDFLLQRKTSIKIILLEKLPFIIISILISILGIYIISNVESPNYNTSYSFFERIIYACYGYIEYIIKLLIPYKYSAVYLYPESINGGIPFKYYLYIIPVLGVISLLIISIIRRFQIIAFSIFFFTFNTILILQIIPYHDFIIADRYTYMSSIGIFLPIAYFSSKIINIKKHRLLIIIPLSCYLLYIGIFSFQRSKVWNNSISLWTDVINYNPKTLIAWNNRGLAKKSLKDYYGALNDFEKSTQISSSYIIGYINCGNTHLLLKNYQKAIYNYNQVIKLDSTKTNAYSNRGIAYASIERYNLAFTNLSKAIMLDNTNAGYYLNRALISLKIYNKEMAIDDLEKASYLDSENAKNLLIKLKSTNSQ